MTRPVLTWPHVSVSECLLIPAACSALSFPTIPRMFGPHLLPSQNPAGALADVGGRESPSIERRNWGPSAPEETCKAHRWGAAEPGDPRPAASSSTALWPTPSDYANPPSVSPNHPPSVCPNPHGLPPLHTGLNGAVSVLGVSLLTPGTRPALWPLALPSSSSQPEAQGPDDLGEKAGD